MNQQFKSFLSIIFRFGLSAVLLIYLYSKIDVASTYAVVKTADLVPIIISLVIFLFINILLLLRWNLLIKALGLSAPLINVARYFFIGLFGNLFLPSAIGGDVIKTIGLCSGSQEKPKAVASVLLDRVCGFAGMVGVATLSFLFGFRYIKDWTLFFMIAGMALALTMGMAVLFNEKLYSFGCKIFTPFPKLVEALMQMHYDIALLKGNKMAFLKATGMSAVGQVSLAMVFYFIGLALHQEISYIYYLIFVPLICVASCFPSIGGLGVREAGAAYLFSKIGVASGIAVSISLINFIYMVLVGLFGWVFFMVTKPQKNEGPHSLK